MTSNIKRTKLNDKNRKLNPNLTSLSGMLINGPASLSPVQRTVFLENPVALALILLFYLSPAILSTFKLNSTAMASLSSGEGKQIDERLVWGLMYDQNLLSWLRQLLFGTSDRLMTSWLPPSRYLEWCVKMCLLALDDIDNSSSYELQRCYFQYFLWIDIIIFLGEFYACLGNLEFLGGTE